MSDIRINVTGDGSQGKATLDDVNNSLQGISASMQKGGEDSAKAAAKWDLYLAAAKRAAVAVKDFLVESVKMYAESERVQARLTRVAGQYTETLEAQAEAMSRLYAVDDDVIKQSQTLLVQWGGVGAAAKDVEQAVLDYATATGKDAVEATQDLIRNVESGGVGMAKLGIHFDTTGDRAHDLRAAVGALSDKFGGAAAADANTLHGSLAGVTLAVEDFQKQIGSLLGALVDKSGIAGALTDFIRDVTNGMKLMQAFASSGALKSIGLDLAGSLGQGDPMAIAKGAQSILGTMQGELSRGSLELPGVKSGPTNRGLKEAQHNSEEMERIHEKNLQDFRDFQKEWDELDLRQEQELERTHAKNLESWRKYLHDLDELDEHAREVDEKNYAEELKMSADFVEDRMKEARKAQEKQDRETKSAFDRSEKLWKDSGEQLGVAFVGALSQELERMGQGGEFDVALFVGNIIAAALSVAGTAIGTAYGQPALGAAIGNLAGMGVQMGAAAVSRSNKARNARSTYHDGGWVGAPRHHDGTWIGEDEQRAILQTGERVLSRSEVVAMGGPRRVDAAAKQGGAPGINVSIMAIDAKNAAESFMTDLGKGLREAMRAGRGDVPALLGGLPR